VYTKSMK
jgi:hypothetical protein